MTNFVTVTMSMHAPLMPNELKARLTMLRMTQSGFAEYCGVSLRTVSYWINEGVIPHYARLCLEHAEQNAPPIDE